MAHRKLWKIYGDFPAQCPTRCLLDASGVCMQKQSPVLNELLLKNFDTFWIYSGFMQHSWAIFGDSQENVDLTEDVGKGHNVDKGLSVHCMPIRHTLLYRICWCISSVRPFEPANTTHGIHHIQI